MSITKEIFGEYEGSAVYSYKLTNKNGASVKILTYGGIMNELWMPDRNGVFKNIICGFDNIQDYVESRSSYFGALIGRYGNRIAGGRFTLGGKEYILNKNENGISHLHGGNIGFNRKIWDAEASEDAGCDRLKLSLFSPDGEEGYPGNLSVTVTYTFDDENAVTIHYEAVSDKDTILNMTSHTYYNLNGYDGASVMDQILFIDAPYYDEVDDKLIPVGKPVPVRGTIFDFTEPRAIGNPFDHNFVLNADGTVRKAADLYDPLSGRTLELYTDCPAVQLYTGVSMNGKTRFTGGVAQRPLHALCLETQYSPDTPNRLYMPSCALKAGEKYDTVTKYVFGVK